VERVGMDMLDAIGVTVSATVPRGKQSVWTYDMQMLRV